jgi:hypothetical protein
MIKKRPKKTWTTRTNLLPKLWDRDNLTKKKTEENNKVYFSKQTTSNDIIEKKTMSTRINFSNLWL